MRLKIRHLLFAAAAAAAISAPAQAGALINGGFDDGMNGLEGWTANTSLVQTPDVFNHRFWPVPGDFSTTIVDATYGPVDGWRFAAISADEADAPVLLSQLFTVSGGVTLTGSAAFLGEDAIDSEQYNDYGFVRISRGSWSQTLFSSSIGTVGAYGYTPWTGFSIYLADAGEYTIEAGVVNNTDNQNPSFLLVDAFSVTPEPTTWLMMLAGFFSVGAMIRRRAPRTA